MAIWCLVAHAESRMPEAVPLSILFFIFACFFTFCEIMKDSINTDPLKEYSNFQRFELMKLCVNNPTCDIKDLINGRKS